MVKIENAPNGAKSLQREFDHWSGPVAKAVRASPVPYLIPSWNATVPHLQADYRSIENEPPPRERSIVVYLSTQVSQGKQVEMRGVNPRNYLRTL